MIPYILSLMNFNPLIKMRDKKNSLDCCLYQMKNFKRFENSNILNTFMLVFSEFPSTNYSLEW